MKINNKISFDELDIKFLTELPLISEVLTSSITKMTRVFQPILNDVTEFCLNNIPNGWEIDKKRNENVIYPFTSEYGKENIKSLENFFQLKNDLTFVKRIGTKWENYFQIQFGFYFDENYEANPNKPYFYFLIFKEPIEKYQGTMYPLSFYNKSSYKFQDFKCNIEHPETNHENEQIEIEVDISSTDRIYKAYDLFKTEIMTPYIQNIGI